MGYMKSVDVVLTAHKLSEAQKNAVVELLSGGFTTAKPNTIKSLTNKGLVVKVGEDYSFSADFETELRAAYSQPEVREEAAGVEASMLHISDVELEAGESFHQALMAEVAEIESSLAQVTVFENAWTDQQKIDAGFGETLKWKGTEVWNGLTASEIREDMETAFPVGRQARRVHYTTLRKAFKRMQNKAA